ncbi:DUF1120 domain-containing protein [Pseudomonas orientalis]|nr:DUF1120 domain-containing protein [Pseudomonas orientalis]
MSIDMPSRALITVTLLLGSVSNVIAASSVDLSVVGVITPSACTPTLSNSGVVDHGKLSVQDFPANEMVLPQATLQLEVICDGPLLMAVKSTDNRAGTANVYSYVDPRSVYGLGLASGGEKIGRYTFRTANATADGNPAAVIESVDQTTWMGADVAVWQPGWMRSVSSGGLTPMAVTTFKADLLLDTVLASKRSLPITEEIQIDGSATLDVVYL